MAPIHYEPTWRSLREHPTPQWFRDAKFGIYTHWGVYSVPGFGSSGAASNATWYPHRMYVDGSPHQKHHLDTYGPLDRFGYKDFVPLFMAPRFRPGRVGGAVSRPPVRASPARWASITTGSPCGRPLRPGGMPGGWGRSATSSPNWSVRSAGTGMRYMVALHHAEHWWFYPHWRCGLRHRRTGARRASTASRTIWSSPTACRKWNSSARPAT